MLGSVNLLHSSMELRINISRHQTAIVVSEADSRVHIFTEQNPCNIVIFERSPVLSAKLLNHFMGLLLRCLDRSVKLLGATYLADMKLAEIIIILDYTAYDVTPCFDRYLI